MANFASDNTAPVHPAVLRAITAANDGHVAAYGDDQWTAGAMGRIKALLGAEVEAFPVWNGTGANVLGLSTMLRPRDAIICTEDAHIHADEGGAPERFTGAKLIDLPTEDGRLRVPQLEPLLRAIGDQHHVQPRVVAVTQSTERGTVYTPAELKALCDWSHTNGLFVHMDGARIANATAALGGDLKATTKALGVDVLSFGFTKNGGLGAEVVVFLDPKLAEGFRFVRKQGMQLASKMRYVSAQVDALLTDDLWLTLGGHANAMARRLAAGVAKAKRVRLARQPEANAIFAHLPDASIPRLQARHPFYVWKPGEDGTSEVRWMCSWDTTEADVDDFVQVIGEELG